LGNFTPRRAAFFALHDQRIVVRVPVPDVGDNGQSQRLFVQGTAGTGPPHASATPRSRVPGDSLSFTRGATWKELANTARHALYQLFILLLPTQRVQLTAMDAQLFVGEAFLLGLSERGLLNKNPLALVPFTGAAESDHHRRQRAVLPGAASQRRVPARQKHKVVQIGASRAQRLSSFHQKENRSSRGGPIVLAK